MVGPAHNPGTSPVAISISQSCPGKQVDLNTGKAPDGTTATDFGPCINKLLATAMESSPVTLLVDGSFAVSGIYGPVTGHWHMIGLGGGMDGGNMHGSGFYQIAGTNGDVIHNGEKHRYEPGQPGRPAERGADVVLENFVINGNRRNGTNGNNTSGDPRRSVAGVWTFGVALHSLNHVRVSGIYTYNIASFNHVFDDIGDGEFSNNTCANTGPKGGVAEGQNGDCWHVDGPGNDLRSSNVTCRATDDCFALNAPESQGGIIERVSISDWTMDARTCGRMYTDSIRNPNGAGLPTPLVRSVSVSHVNCVSKSWAIMFGQADSDAHTLTTPDSITDVRITDSTFSSPFGFIVSDSVGSLTIADTIVSDITCNHDGLPQPYCGFVQIALNGSIPVRHLSLVNDTLRFTPVGHAAIAGAINTFQGWNSGSGNKPGSAVFDQVNISGFCKVDEGGSYGTIGQLITLGSASTIATLHLEGNDMSNISDITNAPSQIRATQQVEGQSASSVPRCSGTSGLPRSVLPAR